MNKAFSTDGFTGFSLRRAGSDAEQNPLVQFIRTLRRRLGFIVAVTSGLVILAAIAVFNVTPLYTAQTLLLLEPERTGAVVDVGAVVSGLPADVSTIESEVEVMRSRGLAAKVVDRVGLNQHPEFNPVLRTPSWLQVTTASIRTNVSALIEAVTGWNPDQADTLPALEQSTVDQFRASDVVDAFMERREVTSVGRSRAIVIAFTSENPELAARATEALAELYIVERLQGRLEAAREVTTWLGSNVQSLRVEVEAKERAVQEYRKRNDLLRGERGEALLSQEISELNQQRLLATGARTEAEAKLAQIQRLMAQGQGATADAVLVSPLIQDLRRDEARLVGQVSDYATRLGPNHPTMRNTVAQLTEIRQTIDREIRNIAKGLENVATVARNREAALRAQMDQAKSRVVTSNSVEVQLRSLEQEASTSRSLLETFLQRFNATTAQGDMAGQQADARIVSPADVPDEPSFPSKGAVLALSFVAGLLVSIALVFMREMMDDTFHASEEVEQETGATVLGLVPRIEKWRHRRRGLAYRMAHAPRSLEAESVRWLCTGIQIARRNGASNRIMVTSAQPGEGKTSLCAAIARAHAMAKRKVLLIDADLRRPAVHRALGLWQGPGLIELMTGQCSIDEAVQRDPEAQFDVITAGSGLTGSPQEILSCEAMERLLVESAKSYDLVIIDTPPVSAVSDTLLLANLASVVFVIKWGGVPKKIVKRALREVLDAGGNIMGVVLSQVRTKEHVRYGFSDSGAYLDAVRKYYSNTESARV